MTASKQLKLFRDTVSELRNSPLIRDKKLRSSFKINFNVATGMQFDTSNFPDEIEFRSFLLTFRFIVSEKEPIFLNKIFNTCYALIEDERLRDFIRIAREDWKEKTETTFMITTVDGNQISSREILKLWLNGRYFHRDESKAKRLRQLGPAFESFFKYLLLDYIVVTTNKILWLDNLIANTVREGLLKP